MLAMFISVTPIGLDKPNKQKTHNGIFTGLSRDLAWEICLCVSLFPGLHKRGVCLTGGRAPQKTFGGVLCKFSKVLIAFWVDHPMGNCSFEG